MSSEVSRRQAQERIAALRQAWQAERREHIRRAEEAGTEVRELLDVAIDEARPAAGDRTWLWLVSREGVLARDTVRLRSGDPVRLVTGNEVTPAVVARWGRHRLGVVIEGGASGALWSGGFRVVRDFPTTTFDRGDRAMRLLAEAEEASDLGRLRAVAYGGSAPTTAEPMATPVLFDTALNGPQQEAVHFAMSTTPVALVFGPPGTGKTRTLVEIVRQHRRAGRRVLVSAASNAAVDNLAERLIAHGVDVTRIGHPARVLASVEAHSLDAKLDDHPSMQLAKRWFRDALAANAKLNKRIARGKIPYAERRMARAEVHQLFRDSRRHQKGLAEGLLERSQVVCATLAAADGKLLWGPQGKFDVVVVDEASQAVDPLLWCALQRAPRVVLGGDPQQLPPTVFDHGAARAGLARSLFETLENAYGEAGRRLLTIQHRMHRDLMAYVSKELYGGRLQAHPAVADHRVADLEGVETDPGRSTPLVFVDSAGKGWAEVTGDGERDVSRCNPELAARTAAEVRRVISRGVPPGDIAVISPYDGQVRALIGELGALRDDGLEIGTVDGFQGREKEVVVVDLVRSNDDGQIGFLSDVRRMNVALTRARRLLIVVGDSATLSGHDLYAGFIGAAEELGGYVSAWSDDAEPLNA